MSRRNNIPKGATLVSTIGGRIDKPDAWTHGRELRVSLYRDYCSQGYRSNYQAIPCSFVLLKIAGEPTRTWQYSGKRLELGPKHYQKLADDLTPYFQAVTA